MSTRDLRQGDSSVSPGGAHTFTFCPEKGRMTIGVLLRTGSQLFHMSIDHFSSRGLVRNEVSGSKNMPDGEVTPVTGLHLASPQVPFILWHQIHLGDPTLASPSFRHALCCSVCLTMTPIITAREPLHGS